MGLVPFSSGVSRQECTRPRRAASCIAIFILVFSLSCGRAAAQKCAGGTPNGVVESGEQCDDGNRVGSDDCTSLCTTAFCGDGIVYTRGAGAMEECDEGAANSDTIADACRSDCTRARCGDGLVDSGEACDDGNTRNDDACRSDCVPARCGDGVLCAGATCVSGPDGGLELCDDGNAIGSDDCTNACAPNHCGDGIPHTKGTPPFDTCDDGNTNDQDACPNTCRVARCGDGIVCSDSACVSGAGGGQEACDDGNRIDHDACRNDCSINVCGDGVARTLGEGPFEECDDGARNSDTLPGACRSDCRFARCGDGVVDVDAGEQCDPGSAPVAAEAQLTPPCSAECRYAPDVEESPEGSSP